MKSNNMDATPSTATTAPAAAESDVRRILIADDNLSGLQLLVRLLKPMVNAELHEVRDGTAALAQFNLLKPRITLLDIDMPELDGMTVLEQIRAIDKQPFVVMVSAYSKPDVVRRAVELGIGGFVVKPYSAQRLAAVLRQYAAQTGDAGILRTVR